MSVELVRLLSGSRVVATLSRDSTLGRRTFEHVAEDAKFLSSSQFRIFLVGKTWALEHVAEAVNETLCNGKPVFSCLILTDGMTISVGNSTKGISKFPLIVRLEGAPESTPPHKTVSDDVASFLSSAKSLVARFSKTVSLLPFCSALRTTYSAVRPIATTLFAALVAVTAELFRALPAGYSARGGGFGGACARVHEGASVYGTVILTIDGDRVCQGDGPYGSVVAVIIGNTVVRGSSPYGEVVANLVDDKVVAGSSAYGDVIARIRDHQVVAGVSPYGDVIASVEGGGRMACAAAATFLLRM